MGPSIGNTMAKITVSKGLSFGQRIQAAERLQRKSIRTAQRIGLGEASRAITKAQKQRKANIAARKKREKK